MTADGTQLTGPAAGDRPDPAAVRAFRDAVLAKLTYAVGKSRVSASRRDWFIATALAARDHVVEGWLDSTARTYREGAKRVYYLSLEFLVGRMLSDVLNNLCLSAVAREALAELDVDLDALREAEPDAALGNGGLGRLAACFMESMASLGIPAHGYGIRYDHGLFRQVIKSGWQQEYPEEWLSFGNPWEFERPELIYDIGFGGAVEAVAVSESVTRHVWHPAEKVEAVAFDTPVVGWRGRHVNTLRLWSARPVDPLRLDAFNLGDHAGALAEQVRAEAISKVLYPSDATPAGLELRLRQEYFFASASLQDLVRRHLKGFGNLRSLPDQVAIQLNDTHPAIAVAEMMRILVDLHSVPWEEAWRITRGVFRYTNHTLLPEALETWPVPLMERLLPRHMQIIYLVNALHIDLVRGLNPGNDRLLSSVSLIDESHGRRVRMGHLAFLGSDHVNGVSALHTDLMRRTVFRDLHGLYPERISNKTNGITFRRWLHQANPALTQLLTDILGPAHMDDPRGLAGLAAHADDASAQERLARLKLANKIALAERVRALTGVRVDPHALFDVQIKRIHEYKRQLLNILETIALYDAIRSQPAHPWVPRVRIFAGKAAASYAQAKLIIKLIVDVARVINNDPTVRDLLKVVFLPNYNVSLAEAIIPASDLSEQISTAGMEASGTGNMKLALNGALTIGTLDGANIEILDHVGQDNIFIFGMTAEEVDARRRDGCDMTNTIGASTALSEVLDAVESGVFSPGEPDRFRGLAHAVRYHDWFMVAGDFDAYAAAQREVDAAYRNESAWRRAALLNIAGMGWFSADRTIGEYARELWGIAPGATR